MELLFVFPFRLLVMTHPGTGEARRRVPQYCSHSRYSGIGRRGSLCPMPRQSDRTLSFQLLGTGLEKEKIFTLLKCRRY